MDARLDAATRLRSAGLRVTAPQLAVFAALPPGTHRTADTMAVAAREKLGSLSTQAVYDMLRAFVAAGLVRQIQPDAGAARFETRAGDNHHHVLCRSCGATADVDCVVGAAPCLDPSSTAGFAIDEAEIVFRGLCPPCKPSDVRRTSPESLGRDATAR